MTPADTHIPFEALTPRDDASVRLLVLLAKSALSDAQAASARLLATNVSNWDEFVDIATRKFSVTFASRHLDAIANDIVPRTVLVRMRQLSRAATMATLRVVAAQLSFHRTCIETTGARYAYLKGIALAQQTGQNPGERYCRDIDVLVAARDFEAVIKRAVAVGYRALLDEDTSEFAGNSRDLAFLCRHADVVTLLGPDSVSIEVHRRLDKLSLKFDLDAALSSAAEVEISGLRMKTLSIDLHLVYLCYHHSRHFWSHLHWLVDLDALIRLLGNDRARVRALADAIGIRPTIEASFEFQELIANPDRWDEAAMVTPGGGQFLKACIVNLEGDLELERELRHGMTLSDFMSAWQISPGRKGALWFNSWLRRLRPSVSQYVGRRYPPALHWLYSLENAIGLAKNGLALLGGGTVRLANAHKPSPTPSGERPG